MIASLMNNKGGEDGDELELYLATETAQEEKNRPDEKIKQ
jgi:hypothetical protein